MKSSSDYKIIIPARYASSRYPGKPLVDLCGKSMIHRTWLKCCSALGESNTFIATDDSKIQNEVMRFGGNVVTTSSSCLTGTDRVAEAAIQYGFENVVNVQGDEPLIEPDDILKVIECHSRTSGVVNAMLKIEDEDEFRSDTIPKVVTSPEQNLLYMSRSPIPGSKGGVFQRAFKQVCIYAFSIGSLRAFREQPKKTPLESIEDIEILRFVELGVPVRMVEVFNSSVAVDTEHDADKVRKIISEIENISNP